MTRLGDQLGLLCASVEREVESAVLLIRGVGSPVRRRGPLASARMGREAERLCNELIAVHHPATDMVFLTTALKIITDLQRIAEVSARLAADARRLPADALPGTTILPQLAGLALAQVRTAIAAFLHLDRARASGVVADRELLNAAHQRVVSDLLSLMIEDAAHRPIAERLLRLTKQLDTVCDHAANAGQLVLSML